MNSGIFVMSYAMLFFGLFICFGHIRDLNAKLADVENARKIKLKKMNSLFLQADKNSKDIFYLRIIILQVAAYTLGVLDTIGFVLAFYVSLDISVIIYYSLFFLMGALAGFAQTIKKKKQS